MPSAVVVLCHVQWQTRHILASLHPDENPGRKSRFLLSSHLTERKLVIGGVNDLLKFHRVWVTGPSLTPDRTIKPTLKLSLSPPTSSVTAHCQHKTGPPGQGPFSLMPTLVLFLHLPLTIPFKTWSETSSLFWPGQHPLGPGKTKEGSSVAALLLTQQLKQPCSLTAQPFWSGFLWAAGRT